ncbi:MAG TPA: methyltransferase domain-containing protein [Methylophilus sp.]|nr:methyltransferase domain-containing protein [Methylophilus sp.]HQQ33269.1 methyltransferase domain-containing protein [Methylophilus sp.]
MYAAIYNYLKELKSSTTDETNGRHIIPNLVIQLCRGNQRPSILDVGAGYGKDLLAVKASIPEASLYAVEGYLEAVKFLRSSSIEVTSLNLERDKLPHADESFDVVMNNQVLEHVKELFWVVSELSRVCKVGGHLVIGVPNLGSLHNRIALLFGKQPPAIHVFGPHIRGFTNAGLRDFLEEGNILRVEQITGGNFYPFPASISRHLARWFPGLAVSSFFVIRKLSNTPFISILNSSRANELVDTPYYRGTTD